MWELHCKRNCLYALLLFLKTKNVGCGSSVSGFLHPNIFVAIRCMDNNASYRLKMHLTAQTLEKDGKSAKIALHSEKDR